MNIKIDKDIPIPTRPRKNGEFTETLALLEVGDSFFCTVKHNGVPGRITGAKRYGRVPNGHKFVTRAVTENGVQGVRVWRTK